jgi:hypothetical protein
MLINAFEKVFFNKKNKTKTEYQRETFYHALCYDNVSLIEIFVEDGFEFSKFSYRGQSALLSCMKTNSVKTLEYLLIMSMRKNNLFLYKDLLKLLNWALVHKHFQIIEITLYALKQEPDQDSLLIDFVTVKDYFSSLCEHLKLQNNIPEHQLSHFSSLVKKHSLTKDQLKYLYYLWEKDSDQNSSYALALYKILADEYHKIESLLDLSLSYHLLMKLSFKAVFIIFLLLFTLWEGWRMFTTGISFLQGEVLLIQNLLVGKYDLILLFLLLYLGLTIFLLFYLLKCAKKIISQLIENVCRQKSQQLLYEARSGNFNAIVKLMQEEIAHRNVIAGLASSSPFFEAARMGHKDIERYFEENQCYKMKKNILK